MPNFDQNYVNEIAKDINNRINISIPAQTINDCLASIERLMGDKHYNPLDSYKELFESVYIEFMNENLSKTRVEEDLIENTVYFITAMDSIFENTIGASIENLDKSQYTFGGLTDDELMELNTALFRKNLEKKDTMAHIFLNQNSNKTNYEHVENFNTAFNNLSGKANSFDDVCNKLMSQYVVIKNNYYDRNIFSRWIFPTAYKERSIINEIRQKVSQLTGDNKYMSMTENDFDALVCKRINAPLPEYEEKFNYLHKNKSFFKEEMIFNSKLSNIDFNNFNNEYYNKKKIEINLEEIKNNEKVDIISDDDIEILNIESELNK